MTRQSGEVVRHLYDAFNAGDRARATELADPDLVWIPTAGSIEGRESALRSFRDRAEMFDEFTVEVERLAETDKVVALLRASERGISSAEIEIRIGHLWAVRDGVVVRGEGHGDRAEALRSAGLEP